MAGSSKNLSEAETDAERVAIWWLSIGMIMVFLTVGLLLLEFELSKPKVSTPIECAWY